MEDVVNAIMALKKSVDNLTNYFKERDIRNQEYADTTIDKFGELLDQLHNLSEDFEEEEDENKDSQSIKVLDAE